MSLQLSASLNLTGSINLSGSFTSTQTMTITSSISVNSLTASYINANNVYGTVTSSSYSLSSSFAPTNTNITASWSNNSLTASYVVNAQSASYYGGSVTSASYSLSSSFAPTNTNITASWSTNSLTASNLVTTNNYTVNNINSNGTGSFSIIGIGSSSPDAKLDIRQTSAATGLKVFVNDTTTANIAQFIGYDNSLGDTTRMVVQAGGNVGIGTFSPSGILDIQSSNSGDQLVRNWNTNTSGTGKSILRIANSGNNAQGTQLQFTDLNYYVGTISSDRTNGMAFYVGQQATPLVSERMRITAAGYVGIGTSTTTSGLQIQTEGTNTTSGSFLFVNSTNASFGGGAIGVGYQYAAAVGNNFTPFRIRAGTTNAIFTVNSAGTIYAGDSTGAIAYGNHDPYFAFNQDTNTGMDWAASDTLTLKTGGTERLRIDSSGNVGIGTSSPSYKLDVAGGIKIGGEETLPFAIGSMYLSYNSAINRIYYGDGTGYDLRFSKRGAGATTDFVTFKDTGNVGIGTSSPASLLSVQGDINSNYNSSGTSRVWRTFATNHDSGNRGAIVLFGMYDGSPAGMNVVNAASSNPSYNSQYLTFLTHEGAVSADERMRITSLGSVGIGTTSPGYTLEVNGTQRVVGNFYLFNTVVNPASNFANQRGVGFEASTGKLEVAASGSNALSIGRFGSTGQILDFRYAGTQIGNFSLDTNDLTLATARHLILSPTGNVGIGTSSPVTKLTVSTSDAQSHLRIIYAPASTYYTDYDTNRINFNGSNQNFAFRDNSTDVLYLKSGGNIGIGTTSVSANLVVGYNATPHFEETGATNVIIKGKTNNSRGLLEVHDSNGTVKSFFQSVYSTGLAYIGTISAHSLALTTGAIEKARLDTNGNLGVGTSTVSRKIHGYVDTGPVMRLQSSGSNASIEFIPSSGHNRYNWLIGAQQNVSDAFEITPSTATNGTTFSTPSLLIKSDGNVGIGTTSPAQKLDVRGYIVSDVNSNAAEGGFYLGNSGHGLRRPSASNDVYLYTTSGTLYLGTTGNSSQQITLLNGGNVGIGTTSPASKLHIVATGTNDGIILDGTSNPIFVHRTSGTDRTYLATITSPGNFFTDASAYDFIIRSQTSNILLGRGSGASSMAIVGSYIGIGTTSPANKLHVIVAGGLYNASITNQLQLTGSVIIQADNSGVNSRASLIMRGNDAIGGAISVAREDTGATWRTYMAFYTNNVTSVDTTDIQEKMRLNADGNLGIGTTSPNAKLQISGSSANLLTVGTLTNDWGGVVAIGTFDGNGIILSKVNTNNDSNRVLTILRDDTNGATIAGYTPAGTSTSIGYFIRANASSYFNGGNVGIGTSSPGYKLDVLGDLRISGSTSTIGTFKSSASNCFISLIDSSGDNVFLGNDDGDFLIQTPTSAYSTKLIVKDDGNVGIGTTSPGAKLDVVGSAAISSTLTVTGTTALNGAVNLSTSGTPTVTLGSASSYGVLTASGSNAASIYLNGASRTGFEAKLQFGAAEHQWFNGSLSSQIMTLNTTGLGIGTSSPIAPLDVQCNTGATGIILRGRADNSTALRFYANNGTTQQLYIGTDDSNIDFVSVSTRPIRFFVNALLQYQINQLGVFSWYDGAGGTRMTLNSTGLGIGTTSPTQKLEVLGAGLFGSHGAGTYSLAISNNDQTNARIRITNSGTGGRSFSIVSGNPGLSNAGFAIYDETSAETRMYISGSGNVGIGTTSPTSLFTVGSTTTTTSSMTLQGEYQSSVFNNANIFNFRHGGFDRWRLLTTQNSAASNDFDFSVNAINATVNGYNTYVTVKGLTGNVGIGTTSPAAKLQVEGNDIRLNTEGSYAEKSLYFRYSNNAKIMSDSYLTFLTSGTPAERMRIDSNGNVGIGTSSPTAKLQVGTQMYSSAPDANYFVVGNENFSGPGPVGGISGYPATANRNQVTASLFDVVGGWERVNGSHALLRVSAYDVINSTPALTVLNNGNVGIGTTSPIAKLDIRPTTDGDAGISIGTGGAVSGTICSPANLFINANTGNAQSGDGRIAFGFQRTGFTGGSEVMRIIENGGYVGIGTSNPTSKLDIRGGIQLLNSSGSTSTATSASLMIFGQNTKGGGSYHDFLYIRNTLSSATNSQKWFRIDNVGIIEIINDAYNTAIFSLTNAGVLSTPGGGTSDIRTKQNVEYIYQNALPTINKLKPVKFEFKNNPNVKRHGFIAQDVLPVKPDLVLGDGDTENGTYGLDYDGILALTVKALQEANIKIEQLEARISQLENK